MAHRLAETFVVPVFGEPPRRMVLLLEPGNDLSFAKGDTIRLLLFSMTEQALFYVEAVCLRHGLATRSDSRLLDLFVTRSLEDWPIRARIEAGTAVGKVMAAGGELTEAGAVIYEQPVDRPVVPAKTSGSLSGRSSTKARPGFQAPQADLEEEMPPKRKGTPKKGAYSVGELCLSVIRPPSVEWLARRLFETGEVGEKFKKLVAVRGEGRPDAPERVWRAEKDLREACLKHARQILGVTACQMETNPGGSQDVPCGKDAIRRGCCNDCFEALLLKGGFTRDELEAQYPVAVPLG